MSYTVQLILRLPGILLPSLRLTKIDSSNGRNCALRDIVTHFNNQGEVPVAQLQ